MFFPAFLCISIFFTGNFELCRSENLPHLPLYVDKNDSGHGNFSTVQSAIDSVPSNNNRWIRILISAGTYREKVKIPSDKPYIFLRGEGRRKTEIVWDDHESIAQSPTFMSLADNIIAKGISFVNSYNLAPTRQNSYNLAATRQNSKRVLPAVAAMIAGDKSAFYRCRFSSVQDTLWDENGRHYFKSCVIQGSVDFIFGGGQSIYEDCMVQVLGEGFITAQGRSSPNDTNGFVFKKCRVVGAGLTYLGRPWRSYARVLFYKSNFSSVIEPEGWNAWNFAGHENQITFAEDGNYGPGADTSKRVSWEKKLSSTNIKQLTSLSFIDDERWIQQQPS